MHLCARKSASLARGVASLPRLAVLLVITTVLAYAQTPLTRKPVLTLQNGSANGYCRYLHGAFNLPVDGKTRGEGSKVFWVNLQGSFSR